jgi:cephalosporin hydroxylase
MIQSDVHFDIQTLYQASFKVTYRGVPAWRCPFDYLIYQILICKVKPDLVIELGTKFGGSSLYISDLQKLNTQKGVVHTIDINNNVTFESDNNILFFRDGWQNYDVQLAKKYQNIMIIDDASHHYQDVLDA